MAGGADLRTDVDLDGVRAYRLARTRAALIDAGLDAVVLFDPLNLRYATGCRNMQIWTSHHFTRYVFVPAEGPVVLFDYGGAQHMSDGLGTIDETRPAISWDFFGSGARADEHARAWAAGIIELLHETCGVDARLGIDRADLLPLLELQRRGVALADAKGPMDMARCIKSDGEVALMRESFEVSTGAIAAMRKEAVPGVSENYLLSVMNQYNLANGGEHQETRLLVSGHRTNPWFNEASEKVVEAGDMLVFDTDLIGPHGIFADQTRSFVVGDVAPTDEQRRLYAAAHEELHYNLDLLRPGVGLEEFVEKAFPMPEEFVARRYAEIVHGIGLGAEYPFVYYPQDAPHWQYPGELRAGMTVCVESYVGREDGVEGVKLEQPVLITDDGPVPLTEAPFELDYL
ncbi:MAG: Xaa-Pro peptidase family protein [Actinomycetota bacterium]